MIIKVAKGDTFIPNWRGNDKLPEDEQIKVEFMYMTGEQEESLTPVVPAFDDNNNIKIEYKLNATAVWDACVKKVTGLKDENGKAITDPSVIKTLPGTYGLITEVAGHIRRELRDTDSKN